jgi:BirA family biotin operon repressor/biotin-[acetyl-CoA-carboxylase] ligase
MEFELGGKARENGYRLAAFPTIGSTNAEALARARAGDLGRLWVVSPEQTAGRGRRGRSWSTPVGNLAASLLLVVEHGPSVAATLGFVAGLALDEALRAVAPSLAVRIALDGIEGGAVSQRDRLQLKWPNDVLLDGAKLAGILLEAEPLGGERMAVIVGIGANVVAAPIGLPYPATSLRDLDVSANAADLFRALSDAWAAFERIWNNGRGFGAIRRLWLDRAAGVGERVAVRAGDSVTSGIFETIDEQGRLLVRGDDGGIRTIAAGDVHFGATATVR